MLLSEQILEIARQSNPKNNLSMYNKAKEIMALLNTNKDTYTSKQLYNITNSCCNTLQKEGYSLFKIAIFYDIVK